MKKVFGILLLAGLLAGCRTSEVLTEPARPGQRSASGAPVIANVSAVNYGYYLFGCLPIWSGNPNRPNQELYWMWKDAVHDHYQKQMMDFARRKVKGDRIEDYSSNEHFSGVYTLWIVWRKVLRSNAVIVKNASR